MALSLLGFTLWYVQHTRMIANFRGSWLRGGPRFHGHAAAYAVSRGNLQQRYPLHFVRVEPFVVPKKSLTGDNTERVDTRVLQVIYKFDPRGWPRLFVGQQVEVFIEAPLDLGCRCGNGTLKKSQESGCE